MKNKIILFILLLMIVSVIFIIIINKYTTEEFTGLSNAAGIPQLQQKLDLVDDTVIFVPSDDKKANTMIQGPIGAPGPQGDNGLPGKDGTNCKCKLPLFKFIDQQGNVLAQHPVNDYPSSQDIAENGLVEIIIPVPDGTKGETGSQGVIGPSGYAYAND